MRGKLLSVPIQVTSFKKESNGQFINARLFLKTGVTVPKTVRYFEHPAGYTRHVRDPKVWKRAI